MSPPLTTSAISSASASVAPLLTLEEVMVGSISAGPNTQLAAVPSHLGVVGSLTKAAPTVPVKGTNVIVVPLHSTIAPAGADGAESVHLAPTLVQGSPTLTPPHPWAVQVPSQ